VYAASMDHNLYALDAATGQKKWAFPTTGFIRSTPVIANGVLVFGNSERHIFGVGPDGTQKWDLLADGPIEAPLVAAGSTVYAVSAVNTLYALDANSGAKIWDKSLVKQ